MTACFVACATYSLSQILPRPSPKMGLTRLYVGYDLFCFLYLYIFIFLFYYNVFDMGRGLGSRGICEEDNLVAPITPSGQTVLVLTVTNINIL